MSDFEKTSYETNPVESPFDAICAFVEAYDALQNFLVEFNEEIFFEPLENDENETDEEIVPPITFSEFATQLREAMYRPVRPEGDDIPPIGIYEIGVVFVPEGAGKYGINSRKLKAALRTRESDVRALFVQNDGILPQLCEMISDFLSREKDLNDYVFSAALRFLNECRRMTAMWA
jgi:flagellar capping protein FliD